MRSETIIQSEKALEFRGLLRREWRQFSTKKSNFGVLIGFSLVPAVVATLNISAGWDTAGGLKRLPASTFFKGEQ